MSSKYIQIYEKLCPDDPIGEEDPRRPAILAEMRAIHRAATEVDAVAVIEWWQAWPNPQHQTPLPLEFVQDARRRMRGETSISGTKQGVSANKPQDSGG